MNLDEEKEWMMSKRAEIMSLHKAGVIDAGQMMRIQELMVILGDGLSALNDEELSKSGISSSAVLHSMDEAKKAFTKFDEELRGAYRDLLKEKLKALEEGGPSD